MPDRYPSMYNSYFDSNGDPRQATVDVDDGMVLFGLDHAAVGENLPESADAAGGSTTTESGVCGMSDTDHSDVTDHALAMARYQHNTLEPAEQLPTVLPPPLLLPPWTSQSKPTYKSLVECPAAPNQSGSRLTTSIASICTALLSTCTFPSELAESTMTAHCTPSNDKTFPTHYFPLQPLFYRADVDGLMCSREGCNASLNLGEMESGVAPGNRFGDNEALSIEYIMGYYGKGPSLRSEGETALESRAKVSLARGFSTAVIRAKDADEDDNRMLIISQGLDFD